MYKLWKKTDLNLWFWYIKSLWLNSNWSFFFCKLQDDISLLRGYKSVSATLYIWKTAISKNKAWLDTDHVPQDGILQGGISNHEVERVGTRHRIELWLPFSRVQLELVEVLAVWFGNEYDLLASFLIVQPDKRLVGTTKALGVNRSDELQLLANQLYNLTLTAVIIKAETIAQRTATYLVRGKLLLIVDVNQLEGHGKVLVAVCCKGALGFGGILHSMLSDQRKRQQVVLNI